MLNDLLRFAPIVLQNLLTQSVGYLVLVSAVFLLVWRWGKGRFAARRVPAPSRVNAAQLRTELKHTLVTFLVGTLSVGVVLVLREQGLTRLVEGPVAGWQVLAWVVGGLLFNDLWFYGWHRLLHTPFWFRHVHAVHHGSVDVNPFTSYSFHAFEGFILGAWILPAAVWLPVPMEALGALQVIGLLNNVMSHLGYEFFPKWLVRVPLLRWTNTATFHSLHHTRSRGNFGLHTRLWDRLFGTEVPDYEAVFIARSEARLETGPRAAAGVS